MPATNSQNCIKEYFPGKVVHSDLSAFDQKFSQSEYSEGSSDNYAMNKFQHHAIAKKNSDINAAYNLVSVSSNQELRQSPRNESIQFLVDPLKGINSTGNFSQTNVNVQPSQELNSPKMKKIRKAKPKRSMSP